MLMVAIKHMINVRIGGCGPPRQVTLEIRDIVVRARAKGCPCCDTSSSDKVDVRKVDPPFKPSG